MKKVTPKNVPNGGVAPQRKGSDPMLMDSYVQHDENAEDSGALLDDFEARLNNPPVQHHHAVRPKHAVLPPPPKPAAKAQPKPVKISRGPKASGATLSEEAREAQEEKMQDIADVANLPE